MITSDGSDDILQKKVTSKIGLHRSWTGVIINHGDWNEQIEGTFNEIAQVGQHHINCLRTLNSKEQLQCKLSNAKSRYESNLVTGFASKNNSKIVKYIRNFTKSISIPSTLLHDSSPTNSDTDKANLFNNHFYSIFTKSSPCTISRYNNPTSFSNIIITEEEVYDSLNNLGITKAMGPDDACHCII